MAKKSNRGTIDRTDLNPIWCKGCGNYAVLKCLIGAFTELGLKPSETAVVSGIGCSSRIAGYINCFGFNSIHGRSVPIAIGAKLQQPALTVVTVGGDGDMMGIGLNHLAHAARKNVDLTCLILDNHIYGLTKGQSSPTTPLDIITVTHPYGNIDPPLDPVICALAFGATWVGRGSATDPAALKPLLTQAIQHPGFSVLHIISPCLTFCHRTDIDFVKENCDQIRDHDPGSLQKAKILADQRSPYQLGLLYERIETNYEDAVSHSTGMAQYLGFTDMKHIVNLFNPGKMLRKQLNVTMLKTADAVVFTLKGKLNVETMQEFEEDVLDNLSPDKSIIFDMSDLQLLTSSGLRLLLQSRQKLSTKGSGDFILCGLKPIVEKTLIISGFDSILTRVNTLEDALKTVSNNGRR